MESGLEEMERARLVSSTCGAADLGRMEKRIGEELGLESSELLSSSLGSA